MNLQKNTLHQFTSRYCPDPQNYISIDLIGPYKTTSQSNSYTLTVVCNLKGYLMKTPIPDKKRATVAIHLFLEIMLKFSFPRILHSDNRREFKSKNIEHLTLQLSIKNTYISPANPQTNGKLGSSHRFNKDCIQKFYIDSTLEWDQMLPFTTAIFN